MCIACGFSWQNSNSSQSRFDSFWQPTAGCIIINRGWSLCWLHHFVQLLSTPQQNNMGSEKMPDPQMEISLSVTLLGGRKFGANTSSPQNPTNPRSASHNSLIKHDNLNSLQFYGFGNSFPMKTSLCFRSFGTCSGKQPRTATKITQF